MVWVAMAFAFPVLSVTVFLLFFLWNTREVRDCGFDEAYLRFKLMEWPDDPPGVRGPEGVKGPPGSRSPTVEP